MRATKLTVAALAVVAGLSLTACQNDDIAADPQPAASSPAGSSTGGSDTDKGQEEGTVAGTGSNEDGKADDCRTDELEVTAENVTIDGDTVGTVAVTFVNGGGRDCALTGYAGVDLKTDAGSLSAERTGEEAPSVVLKDGKSVSFAVTYPVNDSGGSGVDVTGLVVTPPNETKSVTLDWPGTSLPVTDGSGTPVKVGPIGSAGQGG
ncbi:MULTISPECIES: DUF4232 domain-containing protein [Streptomyces]|jgi:hypothetical protein|uniref:DUF4232 domain-containing protein n=2 Tax=Streptomyces TaxID=1883 RepID=A0ABU3J5L9_9ACTN|nr:DUF4232 domain-containing protein [Streptomyces sp. McG7]MBT2907096.1 DUF4232 domain-containing protein [Streptomyces sp. McG8]MDQ0487924.1 hypothetical protein [Streptomyces thermodiastaticus]MDT6969832.1 DUF4232 domain-containing protein [Streptomyces thermocarboxydus]MDX3418182.1 DUF4232 domain-containing protein [Streptomyces sp. MD20-1-1]MXQ59415.1 DUF4232 domain-containing protein [Streptomyces sp. XHT-2]MYW51730.1 DUF4232 domain-containing protein [Streptomyces sp. SID8376]WSB42805